MNRAVLSERKLLVPAVVLTATLVALAFVVMIVAATFMYQGGGLGPAPITFVMGGYFSFPFELTAFVPLPTDLPLPIPTL